MSDSDTVYKFGDTFDGQQESIELRASIRSDEVLADSMDKILEIKKVDEATKKDLEEVFADLRSNLKNLLVRFIIHQKPERQTIMLSALKKMKNERPEEFAKMMSAKELDDNAWLKKMAERLISSCLPDDFHP